MSGNPTQKSASVIASPQSSPLNAAQQQRQQAQQLRAGTNQLRGMQQLEMQLMRNEMGAAGVARPDMMSALRNERTANRQELASYRTNPYEFTRSNASTYDPTTGWGQNVTNRANAVQDMQAKYNINPAVMAGNTMRGVPLSRLDQGIQFVNQMGPVNDLSGLQQVQNIKGVYAPAAQLAYLDKYIANGGQLNDSNIGQLQGNMRTVKGEPDNYRLVQNYGQNGNINRWTTNLHGADGVYTPTGLGHYALDDAPQKRGLGGVGSLLGYGLGMVTGMPVLGGAIGGALNSGDIQGAATGAAGGLIS